MRAKRRVSAPQRSHPAISTASCERDARLPLPTVSERAIPRPTTTGIRECRFEALLAVDIGCASLDSTIEKHR